MTQLESARKGEITPEIQRVAEKEKVSAEFIRDEIVAGRNWRNLPLVAAVMVLGIANLLMHLEADGVVTIGGWCSACTACGTAAYRSIPSEPAATSRPLPLLILSDPRQ